MKILKSNISEVYKVQVGKLSLILMIKACERDNERLGYVTRGNARKITNNIIFRANPNSYLGT